MNTKAFTLIELLVVVLIIGILSAIALPQYQVSVLKTRYMELIVLGESLHRAEEAYRLANGEYASDMTSLDIEVPDTLSSTLYNPNPGTPALIITSTKLPGMQYVIYLDRYNGSPSRRVKLGCKQCRVDSSVANAATLIRVCEALTGSGYIYGNSTFSDCSWTDL